MAAEDELEYFTRRNRQETVSAKNALEPAARHAHTRLADLHRKNVREALSKAARTAGRDEPDDATA